MRERTEESNEGIARSSRHKETDKRYKKAHALKKISLQMGNKDIPTQNPSKNTEEYHTLQQSFNISRSQKLILFLASQVL